MVKVAIANSGKSDLNISGVSAACNCVSLISPTSKIKPGTETTVELSYSPRVLGNQTEVVKFSSNDIVTPEVKVHLQAQVVKSLTAQSVIRESSNVVPFK